MQACPVCRHKTIFFRDVISSLFVGKVIECTNCGARLGQRKFFGRTFLAISPMMMPLLLNRIFPDAGLSVELAWLAAGGIVALTILFFVSRLDPVGGNN